MHVNAMARGRSSGSQAMMPQGSSYVMASGIHGAEALRRIRTPHPHDVLCGRGGGINSHPGNRTFREWVRERKDAYNLASSKAEKARVSREIVDLVRALTPPGKFLMRDPNTSISSSGWWMEIDDMKAMAKTSQALREGAPTIRAQHKDELETRKSSTRKSARKAYLPQPKAVQPPAAAATTQRPDASVSVTLRPETTAPATMSTEAAVKALKTAVEDAKHGLGQADSNGNKRPAPIVAPLMSNARFAEVYTHPQKVARFNPEIDRDLAPTPPPETPPLMPVPGEASLIFPMPLNKKSDSMKRSHSLALSDIGNDLFDEFVNPFEDEGDDAQKDRTTGMKRSLTGESSSSSHGDMGGIGALMNSPPSDGIRQRIGVSIGSNGQGSRPSFRSMSSRSSISELSDLPDVGYPTLGDTDFTEGLKQVYDAVHPGVTSPGSDDDMMPTHLYPFRGGNPASRRMSPRATRVVPGMEHRQ